MIEAILLLLAGFAVLAALLPFTRRYEWWIRLWDFPRVQIAVYTAAVAAAIVALAPMDDPLMVGAVALLLLCLAHHLSIICPYTPLWISELKRAERVDPERVVSLVVTNVLMDNRSCEGLFEELREIDPDIVLAVETDQWWCDRLAAFTDDYPYKVSHPLDNTYGLFLASKLELVDPRVRFLLKKDIPSVRSGVRLRSGEIIDFFAVHPEPPAPGEADTSVDRDAELVLVGREIEKDRKPAIVAGDLNDVAWSHTSRRFRRLSRMLDPRLGRGFFNTFHANYPFLRWPLDHVFLTQQFALVGIRRLGGYGSDHFPICVSVVYAPRMAKHHDEPHAEPEDREEARDTLQAARRLGIGGGPEMPAFSPMA